MERQFWLDRWSKGEIGFHKDEVHPTLTANVHWWLQQRARVLVPLCGKSLDVHWLAKRGHEVVGVELARSAVEALFAEHRLEPEVSTMGGFEVWRAGRIEVWCADVLELPPHLAGGCDRCWDRAALVAIHPDRRDDYVLAVRQMLTRDAIVLLDVVSKRPEPTGPPFAIDDELVRRLYVRADVEKLAERPDERPGWSNATWAIRRAGL